jgi:hypothetical protein
MQLEGKTQKFAIAKKNVEISKFIQIFPQWK